jgi:hypothetical protein
METFLISIWFPVTERKPTCDPINLSERILTVISIMKVIEPSIQHRLGKQVLPLAM